VSPSRQGDLKQIIPRSAPTALCRAQGYIAHTSVEQIQGAFSQNRKNRCFATSKVQFFWRARPPRQSGALSPTPTTHPPPPPPPRSTRASSSAITDDPVISGCLGAEDDTRGDSFASLFCRAEPGYASKDKRVTGHSACRSTEEVGVAVCGVRTAASVASGCPNDSALSGNSRRGLWLRQLKDLFSYDYDVQNVDRRTIVANEGRGTHGRLDQFAHAN